MTKVSILICTLNRAFSLKLTLECFRNILIPDNFNVELLVGDNGSTDNTREVVTDFKSRNTRFGVEYIFVSQAGKSAAANALIQAAQGDILLWTDDDVRPPADWIVKMCEPILDGTADAVGGPIRIAGHLERPWMTRTHYDRLADTRFLEEDYGSLIGANMCFHRRVLTKVPGFDNELGPAHLGFCEDTLIEWQIKRAGFRIKSLDNATVEHHPSESRLLRRSWLYHAKFSGRTHAYLMYHWEHRNCPLASIYALAFSAALSVYLVLRPPGDFDSEGCHRFEIRLTQLMWFYREFAAIQGTARKYPVDGVTKIARQLAPSRDLVASNPKKA